MISEFKSEDGSAGLAHPFGFPTLDPTSQGVYLVSVQAMNPGVDESEGQVQNGLLGQPYVHQEMLRING